ncbi:MAG: hypothetical protein HZA20_09890 [Nitrospirae bacterium]|nr:hypothetical protein [Nitrospirota bacterium]
MRKETGIFIFVIGLLAFNWPVMKAFDMNSPLYLFVVWAVFILVNMLHGAFPKDG